MSLLMSLLLLLLSLCLVTATSSKLSHVIIEVPKDQNSCGRNEQVLSDLKTKNTKLQEILTQIQNDVSKLKRGGASRPNTDRPTTTVANAVGLGELKNKFLIYK